jgi:hypothetical protein
MKKDLWLYAIALAAGAAVWAVIADATGKREAWDSPFYFSAGIPAGCLVSLVLGFIEPRRSWRWGVLPMAGQFLWLLISQGAGNLLPLGMIAFGVLSFPGGIAAGCGAFMATRFRK